MASKLRFPVELRPPRGFDPADAETWPAVDGRLEFVDGRLLYMPPCGDAQGDVVAAGVGGFMGWIGRHPEFVVSTNEAGLRLAGASRGADIAVWRKVDCGPQTGGFRRVPPILAVEVEGQDEDEAVLTEKARWYLDHGVRVVWLVLWTTREVVVIRPLETTRCGGADRMPAHPDLPDLDLAVAEFFRQLDG